MIKVKKEAILLSPKDIKPSSSKFKVLGVLNPGAVRLPDGKIIAYVRVIEKLKKTEDKKYFYSPRMVGKNKFKVKIDKFKREKVTTNTDLDFVFGDGTKRLTFVSHLRKIMLDKSGFKIISIDKKPSFFGTAADGELGIEDPRITKINNLYVMTYVSLSIEQNISTAIATSYDCLNWERKGIIFGEQDKDVVVFPEKVNGRYVAFNRPEGSFQFTQPHIWIAYSNDLVSWGDLKPIDCVYEEAGFCPRNGAGPPPIKTKKGWLLLYHAVTESQESEEEILTNIKKMINSPENLLKKLSKLKKEAMKKIAIYSVGAALFKLNNPEKLIAKTKKFIIAPRKKYEVTFENKRVVFPTAAIPEGNDILIYSGAGDKHTTVKKISLNEILKQLKKV